MNNKVIYNCHTHIFNDKNIPDRYLPFFLVPAIRVRFLRWVIKGFMKIIIPWTKNDKIHRFVSFIDAAYRKTQKNNFIYLKEYYPPGTRFIILPMDMKYMGAGRVKEDIDKQHSDLSALAENPDYKDLLIPFAHIDPRRPDALDRLRNLVENHNFKGVKIYPTLGYSPDHQVLMDEIYPYMLEKNIPLMAHCSPGIVNSKKMKKADAHALAHPDNYKAVMKVFPELRICLAHFGGIDEWRRHLNNPWNTDKTTWLTSIKDLIRSGSYPNLFTDISYTIFNFQENVPYLNILLEEKEILDKVLFGSDYYMVESQKYSEKRLSIDLRSVLGEEKFWKIASDNPRKYLNL